MPTSNTMLLKASVVRVRTLKFDSLQVPFVMTWSQLTLAGDILQRANLGESCDQVITKGTWRLSNFRVLTLTPEAFNNMVWVNNKQPHSILKAVVCLWLLLPLPWAYLSRLRLSCIAATCLKLRTTQSICLR